jgi:hypothetical protein
MLVDQHPIARRDDAAPAPAHGRPTTQYGAFETGDEILLDVAVLQVLAKITPYRLEPLHGLWGVT